MATTSKKHGHPVRTLVIFCLVTASLFVLIAVSNAWTPKLGLDLRGGTTITLTAANSSGGGAVDPDSLELARTIIQQRVDSLGVGESEVTTSGDQQILVSVPNVQRDELVRMVGQTAQLTFRQVFATDTSAPPESTVAPQETPSPEPAVTADRRPLPSLPTPVPSPRPTTPAAEQPPLDDKLAWQPSERDLADFEAFTCGDPFPDVPDQPLIACDQTDSYKYLLGPALIRGDQLTRAQAQVPANSVNWIVGLEFDSEGGIDFEKVTGTLATKTSPQNQFGIVLDGVVISAPSVNSAIPGGQASIEGTFTQQEAVELANVLSYGALPLSFDVSSVDNVSAKLGVEQLQAGIIAGLIGLFLVVIYSIIYYRGLAVVVVASLIAAGALTFASIVLLGQSMGFALNLPGIAGVIVAIGITADSFVIYFERIRDEVREGRSLRTAIETGWIRSRKTILVADSVSLLSAVVLFVVAIGAVKGFAFTLGLTTLIDIAVVFFFTKPLMTLLGRTKFYGEGHPWSGFGADHMGTTRPPLHNGQRKLARAATAGGEH